MQSQWEKDSNKYNRKYAIHSLALEILRNGSSLMTMLEAMEEATKSWERGNKFVTMGGVKVADK